MTSGETGISLTAEELPAEMPWLRRAAERYVLSHVERPEAPGFADCYALLAAEFGGRGELERRDVLARLLREPPERIRYHLLCAREAGGGGIVGVRDFYATTTPSGRTLLFLSHVLVLPEHRGRGLGALFRHVPLVIARRGGAGGSTYRLAEMEPVREGDAASVSRLVAYERDRFQVVAPERVRYEQPDFRAPEAIERDRARSVPLCLLLHTGEEKRDEILAGDLRDLVDSLYDIYELHCRSVDVAPLRAAFAASVGDRPVPLCRLPKSPSDSAAVQRLMQPHLR